MKMLWMENTDVCSCLLNFTFTHKYILLYFPSYLFFAGQLYLSDVKFFHLIVVFLHHLVLCMWQISVFYYLLQMKEIVYQEVLYLSSFISISIGLSLFSISNFCCLLTITVSTGSSICFFLLLPTWVMEKL